MWKNFEHVWHPHRIVVSWSGKQRIQMHPNSYDRVFSRAEGPSGEAFLAPCAMCRTSRASTNWLTLWRTKLELCTTGRWEGSTLIDPVPLTITWYIGPWRGPPVNQGLDGFGGSFMIGRKSSPFFEQINHEGALERWLLTMRMILLTGSGICGLLDRVPRVLRFNGEQIQGLENLWKSVRWQVMMRLIRLWLQDIAGHLENEKSWAHLWSTYHDSWAFDCLFMIEKLDPWAHDFCVVQLDPWSWAQDQQCRHQRWPKTLHRDQPWNGRGRHSPLAPS